MAGSLSDLLAMLTGYLNSDPMNIEVQRDPYNKAADAKAVAAQKQSVAAQKQSADPTDADRSPVALTSSSGVPQIGASASDRPSSSSRTTASSSKGKSRALSQSPDRRSLPMPTVDALVAKASPTSAITSIVVFSCLGPAAVLSHPVIKKSMIEFRMYAYHVIMLKTSTTFTIRNKANLIDGAIRKVLGLWCKITLAARALAGEGMTLEMADNHIKSFCDSTEVGVIFSIASQVDLSYVPHKDRKEGWRHCKC